MISLHIDAATPEEMKAHLRAFLEGQAIAPAVALAAAPEAKVEEPKPEAEKPAKATRKKAEAAVEPKPEVKAEEPKTDASVTLPSIEDLRAHLMKLSTAEGHGTEAVFTLLSKHGAKNASTVDETKRAAVIADINTLLGG